MIIKGTSDISSMYIGSQSLSAAYVGADKIWPIGGSISLHVLYNNPSAISGSLCRFTINDDNANQEYISDGNVGGNEHNITNFKPTNTITSLSNFWKSGYNSGISGDNNSFITELNVDFGNITGSCTSWYAAFAGLTNCTTLTISNANVGSNFDAYGMFGTGSGSSSSNKIVNLDLSGFTFDNSHRVTNVNSMFANCQYLKTINLSGWKFFTTATSTKYNNMFLNCNSLELIDLGSGQEALNIFNIITTNRSYTKLPTTCKIKLNGFMYEYNSTTDTWVKAPNKVTNTTSDIIVHNGLTDNTVYYLTRNGENGTTNTTGWTFTDTNISFYTDNTNYDTGTQSRIRTVAYSSSFPYRFRFNRVSNIGSPDDAIVISAGTGNIIKMVMHFSSSTALGRAADFRINGTDTLNTDSTTLTGTWEGSAQLLRITYSSTSNSCDWDSFEITYV